MLVRLAAVLGITIGLLSQACAGGGSAPGTPRPDTPTPTLAPDPSAQVNSALSAVEMATTRESQYFGDNPTMVSVERLLAGQAAAEILDMGIPALNVADATPVCSYPAPCPGPPLLSSQPGYLVIVAAQPNYKVDSTPQAAGQLAIQASFVSDDGRIDALGANYPTKPDGLLAALRQSITPTDWELAAEPSGTTVSIKVAIGSSSCWSLEPVEVSETHDVVTLGAFSRMIAQPGQACTEELRIVPVDVQLSEPLGDRRLEGCNGSSASYLSPPSPGLDCRSTLK